MHFTSALSSNSTPLTSAVVSTCNRTARQTCSAREVGWCGYTFSVHQQGSSTLRPNANGFLIIKECINHETTVQISSTDALLNKHEGQYVILILPQHSLSSNPSHCSLQHLTITYPKSQGRQTYSHSKTQTNSELVRFVNTFSACLSLSVASSPFVSTEDIDG